MSLKDGASGLGRWGDREKERGEVGMKRGVGGGDQTSLPQGHSDNPKPRDL